jgi:mannose-6-phosphate isomerase-like protein (cupin superfamily)
MKHHFKLSDTTSFEWPGIKGQIYSSKDDFDRMSIIRVNVAGKHGRVYSDTSDRTYIIVSGSGWFDVAGEKFSVEKDDVIIIPRKTEYDYSGEMELFLINSPSFDPATEHKVE